MSNDVKKAGRFGMLKGVREASTHSQPDEMTMPPAAEPDDTTQEPFSTTLSRSIKRRLKKASADERRKQYLIVEQALEAYLQALHPELK